MRYCHPEPPPNTHLTISLTLLPVQPPEINALSLPCCHGDLQPVVHKLLTREWITGTMAANSPLTLRSDGTKGTYF